jgi:hypothetical protein
MAPRKEEWQTGCLVWLIDLVNDPANILQNRLIRLDTPDL